MTTEVLKKRTFQTHVYNVFATFMFQKDFQHFQSVSHLKRAVTQKDFGNRWSVFNSELIKPDPNRDCHYLFLFLSEALIIYFLFTICKYQHKHEIRSFVSQKYFCFERVYLWNDYSDIATCVCNLQRSQGKKTFTKNMPIV